MRLPTKSELEIRVLDIANRVKAGQPIEDSRVEMKADWLDDYRKLARRIAGLANAADGEPVLWIIGLDENRQLVSGASGDTDLATWLPQVSRCFADRFAPSSLIDIAIHIEDKTVIAILFETDRRPYVVNGDGTGTVDREVPWRDGTLVRSAKRDELLRMLAPIAKLPKIDVLKTTLKLHQGANNKGELGHSFTAMLFVVPRDRERVTIPSNVVRVVVRLKNKETVSFVSLNVRKACFPTGKEGLDSFQVLFDQPHRLEIDASSRSTGKWEPPDEVSIQLRVGIAELEGQFLTIRPPLQKVEGRDEWILDKSRLPITNPENPANPLNTWWES